MDVFFSLGLIAQANDTLLLQLQESIINNTIAIEALNATLSSAIQLEVCFLFISRRRPQ